MNITMYKDNMPVPDTIRVDMRRWEWYVKLMEDIGVNLPDPDSFERENLNVDELRLLQKLFYLEFVWCGKLHITIEVLAGFISDLASVPGFVRSLLDNDALIVLVAAYIFHDPAFGLHLLGEGKLGFKLANQIFRALILYHISDMYHYKMSQAYKFVGKARRRAKKKVEKWRRGAKRDAALYYFGVSTRIGKRIYDSVDVENHWNRKFVRFTCVELEAKGNE